MRRKKKMATANQIYAFINEVQKQALGEEAITVKDTASLVSLGETVLSSNTNKDAFYQKLADRIGYTYCKARVYNAVNKSDMVRNVLDFGIVLQKIQTHKLAKAKSNGSWGSQVNPFSTAKDTTDLQQSLFTKLGVWEIETKVIYDYQLKTAFTDAVSMGAFVNMIFQDMYNALEYEIEQCIKLTKATMIAQCWKGNNTNVRRNLLKEYNELIETPLTYAEALRDSAFLKYASREISKTTKRFKHMTSLFNSAGADRFTPVDAMKVDVLLDFSTATASYLEADTFHKELVALPMFEEIDSWQASGTTYNEPDVINITDEAGVTKEQAGIIATVYDKEACGVMIDRIRTNSMYNPASECTNYYHKADYGTFVDTSENCVVFYMDANESDVQE